MIYLRTGANGTCKTLFTLADVRKLQLETGRPVCINTRFKMNEAKRLEFGWNTVDFKDWQAEPDGTIFLIDECHNDMPVRPASQAVPEPIRMLAEHRSRGFDFFLLTQHPMNIDNFVRKLIGAPGWHQHLKRVFGGTKTTRVLQWDAVNSSCEKEGSGKNAQISTRVQPKEVYAWYDSASLHTAKTKIPLQLWVLGFCAVIIPLCGYYAYQKLMAPKSLDALVKSAPGQTAAPSFNAPPASSGQLTPGGQPVQTPEQFLASYQPRIVGLPHTAPRYDEATKPTTAPYPAACVNMGTRCDCYTQQGTKLQTTADLCKQIVAGGFFQDWGNSAPVQAQMQPAKPVLASEKLSGGNPGIASAVAVVTKTEQDTATAMRDGEVLARMGRVGGGTRPVLAY